MSEQETYKTIIERLKNATNCHRDIELCRLLGISHQSLISARDRKSVPPGWILKICTKFNLSANWLFWGIGPKELNVEMADSNLVNGQENEDAKNKDLPQFVCPRCLELEEELKIEKEERRALATDNRNLTQKVLGLYEDNEKLKRKFFEEGLAAKNETE